MAQNRFQRRCAARAEAQAAGVEDLERRFAQLLAASLCANCRLQSDCAFLAASTTPIVLCELYECGLADRPALRVLGRAPAAAAPESAEEAPLGLCATCEELAGCRLPRPAGGVWNCEEYR